MINYRYDMTTRVRSCGEHFVHVVLRYHIYASSAVPFKKNNIYYLQKNNVCFKSDNNLYM